ncbi:hypothetical protein CapIbe_005955 [Capra ibex]
MGRRWRGRGQWIRENMPLPHKACVRLEGPGGGDHRARFSKRERPWNTGRPPGVQRCAKGETSGTPEEHGHLERLLRAGRRVPTCLRGEAEPLWVGEAGGAPERVHVELAKGVVKVWSGTSHDEGFAVWSGER